MAERDVIVEAVGPGERALTERTTVRLLPAPVSVYRGRGQVQLRARPIQIAARLLLSRSSI